MSLVYDSDKSKAKGKAAAGRAAVGGGIGVALMATLRQTWPDLMPWDAEYDMALVAVVASIWAYVRTVRADKKKHGGVVEKPNVTMWLAFALTAGLVASVAAGCTTVNTKFSETVTDEDGLVTTTTYKALSLAPPLGKLDTTSHEWTYRYGGEENVIATGQAAQGMDNTGQAVLIPLFETMINAIADAYKTQVTTPSPTSGGGLDINAIVDAVLSRMAGGGG